MKAGHRWRIKQIMDEPICKATLLLAGCRIRESHLNKTGTPCQTNYCAGDIFKAVKI
jgi:hypothetical protein